MFLAKTTNKRVFVREAEDKPETSMVQLKIFNKSDGHFAAVHNTKGVKTVTMRLSVETMENLALILLEHLKLKSNGKDEI
jgi:hypothetical protein